MPATFGEGTFGSGTFGDPNADTAFLFHRGRLTELRGLAFLALHDTGYILRATVTDNAGGGGSQTFGTVDTVACRVDPLGGREGVVADRLDERTTHRITVPPRTAVEAADQFKVNGDTYEITAVRTRTQEPVRVLEAVEAS